MTCIPVCVLSLITSGLCVITDGGTGDRAERWSERKWRWEKIVRGTKSERWNLGEREEIRGKDIRDMGVKRKLDFDYKRKNLNGRGKWRGIMRLFKCSVITWWVDDDHYNHRIIINSKILLGLSLYSWDHLLLCFFSWLYCAKSFRWTSYLNVMIHHNTRQVKCWELKCPT